MGAKTVKITNDEGYNLIRVNKVSNIEGHLVHLKGGKTVWASDADIRRIKVAFLPDGAGIFDATFDATFN